MRQYYIASCVFTARFPELSQRIQRFVRDRWGLEVVRCCVPSYKIQHFEERMPEGPLRAAWAALPDSGAFGPGDRVYSLCHNCNNIIEETRPGVRAASLWEMLAEDEQLPLPDWGGAEVTVQDCWRSRDRREEQAAVRTLLDRMNLRWREAPRHHGETDFCGVSLYRPQPPRNPKLAPRHYVEGTEGLFLPHTEEEQRQIMADYCRQYETDTVVCYCHYCLEGLKAGGRDGRHLAELMFGPETIYGGKKS